MLLNLLLTFTLLMGRVKSDPDPLQDYCVSPCHSSHQQIFLNGVLCKDPTEATVSDFTTSALSRPGNTQTKPLMTNVTVTTTANLPGLNTMGLTMARLDFGGSGVVPPHVHPRASEVTVCLDGVLLVGFVDTSGRVFTQELHPGETFVFPKGLIHFLYNIDTVSSALAVSGLNSQNPGTQIVSLSSFIPKPPFLQEVLKSAFDINGQDVARIRKSLQR
ncbi:germin-like protein subfamily 1 member 1 [Arabidopsis lyrata subsp. lyrata]|nr:germin-like protein subfamily 1 member 1 [Arabidopsis lyrata subsp. lyrata]|eukprot:XP_020869588.1 germin-like protein subfamily 1 member 1 [Arabidopsis lyrata subsp. lyrata]